MLTFKHNKIEVLRGVIDPVALDAVQRLVRLTLSGYADDPPGFFRSDPQVKLRYPLARMHLTEAIMYALTPKIREIVGAEVLPTYSFPVINFPGAELERHTDRPACEVTCTLTLINEPETIWPIFIEEAPGKVHRLDLNPGDVAAYDGIAYPHWREAQPEGHYNVSVFYHYVLVGGPFEDWHRKELRQHMKLSELYEPKRLSQLFPTPP
ncbi:MAG TPA: hypothetical protein VG841_10920 [Caulobacterales bacterium]|nr:hypothetical protein [Caulobacterales bacterium]